MDLALPFVGACSVVSLAGDPIKATVVVPGGAHHRTDVVDRGSRHPADAARHLDRRAWVPGSVLVCDGGVPPPEDPARPEEGIIAVAASMLTAVYFMLRDGVEYRDLGGRFLTERDKQETTKRLLRRLRNLGVNVEVKAA